MSCKCLPVAITEVVDGNNLVLTFNNSPVFTNTGKFCFKICPNIVSVVSSPYPVVVNMTVNGTTAQVSLWDKYGNPAYSNTLRRNVIYSGYMGSGGGTNHVIIYNTPCCRS